MSGKSEPPKRRNKVVQLGDMIGNALDPALKRRGFASRDLIANWRAIAPTPYDRISMPDRLTWPRRDRPDPEGAVLYLRCMEGHALALSHEGPAIVSAINRYFGYLLVSSVRLSAVPFMPTEKLKPTTPKPLPSEVMADLNKTVSVVEDDGLREALARLGQGVLGKRER